MLEGAAGAGKSCVAAQTVKQLAARDIPCLAIRLDLIPEGDLSAQAIGRRLDLPDSPVLTLGEYANGRPCVFCIDQLDALSIVSARQQTIWGPFNEMLNEAERYPNMRLLFACRTFDLEQDPRLRKLVSASKIESSESRSDRSTKTPSRGPSKRQASPLPVSVSRSIPGPLESASPVSVPGSFARAGPVDFTEAGDLFDAFWKHKRRSVDERVGLPGSWMPAVGSTVCDALSERESLMAPRYALDASTLRCLRRWHRKLSSSFATISCSSFTSRSSITPSRGHFSDLNNDLVAWLVGDSPTPLPKVPSQTGPRVSAES